MRKSNKDVRKSETGLPYDLRSIGDETWDNHQVPELVFISTCVLKSTSENDIDRDKYYDFI